MIKDFSSIQTARGQAQTREIASAIQPGPLNLMEASFFLKVAPSTLYKWTSKGLIAHFKPNGRCLYFKMEDLEAFVYRNRCTPAYEVRGGKK